MHKMEFTFAMTFLKIFFGPFRHKCVSLHFAAFDARNKSAHCRCTPDGRDAAMTFNLVQL